MQILEGIQPANQFCQSVGVLLVKLGTQQCKRIGQFPEGLDAVALLVQVRNLQLKLCRGGQEFVHGRVE